MEKNNLWLVAVIALIVAVVASLVTVKLTGNIVKVPTTVSTTQTDVYTKEDIDLKFNGLATNQGVLNMLRDKCNVLSVNDPTFGSSITGRKVCELYNSQYSKNTTCIFAESVKAGSITETLPCTLNLNTSVWGHAICCSP